MCIRDSDSKIDVPELRSQDLKNRQNSNDDIPQEKKEEYSALIANHFDDAMNLYNSLLDAGVAKECARFVLPLATPTRIYMSGSIRSWMHYIDLRSAHGTQKEHMDIAEACREIFIEQFPIIAEAHDYVHTQ